MTDDIVTRLRNECQCSDNCRAVGDPCIAMTAADEIERLRAEVARLGSFLHPVGAVVNGYSGSQAETTWVSSDGTITNFDPNTEMGFWIRLFHNECDRSAHLEREIERLRAEVGSKDAQAYRHMRRLFDERGDEIERLKADRDNWKELAHGMATCLDSSTDASDLLWQFEQAVRNGL